jgi:hypothetical protein
MNIGKNKMLIGIVVVIGIILLIYIINKVYNAAVEDATRRIKVGVTEGVEEGISKGAGDIMNPLKLPFRIFGGK